MKTFLPILTLLFISNLTIAQTTAIPDTNFEQALIDLGYDTGSPDGLVLTSNIDYITTLYISGKNISDLTGIEDFTALNFLNCQSNQLTTIDLSQNIYLTDLLCQSNLITSLNLTQNFDLNKLFCSFNQLDSLDISNNVNLTTISCFDNQLTSLNVSKNIALSSLNCNSNQLTSIDVSKNINLTGLYCVSNFLNDLNLSLNPLLTDLTCANNQLTCLNVKNGNNSNLNLIYAINNPNLTCIEVDDASYSTTNWIGINYSFDPVASFNTNCPNICTVGTDKNNATPTASLYPNPTTGNITLNLGKVKQDIKATLLNNLGQELFVKQYFSTSSISLGIDAPSGVYFLQLESEGEIITEKILKN